MNNSHLSNALLLPTSENNKINDKQTLV